MEDALLPIVICTILFLGLPGMIFHYVTQWRKSGTLSLEDERLLDELHDLARRLDDRMNVIERIVAADNPDFRPANRRDRLAEERRASFELPPERDAVRSRQR